MNTVEEYLSNNKNLKLSVKSIAKRTGLRTRQVTFMCHHSNLIRNIDPFEVGSLKTKMNVFTAI
jgi:hypothetical protein